VDPRSHSRHFTLSSFPRAILHFDGDAFFTSVEQALHPELKGRPVVTGKERGIIACASYEAKAMGIRRGVALWEAKKRCPDLVVLPSDYETYSLYSKRMFCIVRRYTPVVQEHSVDEGFADISGLRRLHKASYKDIPRQIQKDIEAELGITVSVGLSLSKVLAKLASKYRKPAGVTSVPGHCIHLFLQKTPVQEVWGFGPNTVHLLAKHGVETAYDFASRSEAWARNVLGKPGKEIWSELRGCSVYPVETGEKTSYASISKCKTFTSPSSCRDYVRARLIRNMESALIKLRRYGLRAKTIGVALRSRDYCHEGLEARLNRPTSSPQEVLAVLDQMFDRLFKSGMEYRAVVVVLDRLAEDTREQFDLFEDRLRIEKLRRVARTIDDVNRVHGKHTLSLGPSLFLPAHRKTERDELPWRKTRLLPGETDRQRLNIPRLAIKV
jgi:DNA polymerase-4/DNA polymerase V